MSAIHLERSFLFKFFFFRNIYVTPNQWQLKEFYKIMIVWQGYESSRQIDIYMFGKRNVVVVVKSLKRVRKWKLRWEMNKVRWKLKVLIFNTLYMIVQETFNSPLCQKNCQNLKDWDYKINCTLFSTELRCCCTSKCETVHYFSIFTPWNKDISS